MQYTTEIVLNNAQKEIYNKTIGTCRFIYNLFIQKNKEIYEQNKNTDLYKYINNYEFSKWLNNDFIPNNPEYKWIKEVYSKAIRFYIDNANKSFINFFRHKTKYPKLKKKDKNDCIMYFVRSDKKNSIKHERHRIKIPTLGWCKLKEYGYIPNNCLIQSGKLKKIAGRYYVSVIIDEKSKIYNNNTNEGIGIDLGIKDLAILSDGTKYKTLKLKKLEKRLMREQRKLSRKYEAKKKNKKKEENTYKNIYRQRLKLQKIYHKIFNTRNDYLNKVINEIIKRKPNFITIEDLSVNGMIKNKNLSHSIITQRFSTFKKKLNNKCYFNGIQLRQVDKFYASSKICSNCGAIKKDLKLSDRIYKCNCGSIIDRDLNASINLRNAQKYKVIA